MRIAVYVRVSTPRQAQTQNNEKQLERLQEYIKEQGWQLLITNIFRDDGYSGFQLKRPGLDKLREKVAGGEFDHVIITAPDRLARNYVHQVLLLEELEKYGCKVEFLDRPMAETPHDQLLLQIRGAVAEYERSLITERMRRGREAKLKAGLILPWTKPPYGYKVDPQKPRDPAGLRRDEVEAVIVKEIFCFYLTHSTTLFGLQKYLAERKIASPSGQKTWGLATLKGILTNPAYTGHLYMGRFSYSSPKVRRSATHLIGKSHDSSAVLPVEQWIEIGTIPAIIDKEEFQKVAEKLIQNRVQAKRNNKTKQYLLRAMVSCGWCNMASIARCLSSGHSYYVCTGKIKAKFLQPEQVCPARFAPADQLDELVWQDLCSLILNPTQIRQALERAYSGS